MGLTLNTNSLNVASSGGGAASGVSTSDVTTLIKNNTPYQFIAKVDAAGSSTISATDVFSDTDGFSAYRIILDSCVIGGNNSNQINMRFAVGGSVITSSVYGWSAVRHYGTSGPNGTYESGHTLWRLMPSVDVSAGYNIVIDLNNTASGLRLNGLWNCSGGNSSTNAGLTFGGGSTSNTGEVSGFEISSLQSFTGGTMRIYGVNNV